MSDFLDSLIDRSLSLGPAPGSTLRPLLPSRFEPQRATPVFGTTGWDSSADDKHEVPADQSSSSFGPADAVEMSRSAPASGGDVDRDGLRASLPLSQMPVSATLGDWVRHRRPDDERRRTEETSALASRKSRTSGPDDNSWLHHRLDELAVQLQRLRGGMDSPAPVPATTRNPGSPIESDHIPLPRRVAPRSNESATFGLRPASSFDDGFKGEGNAREIETHTREIQADERPARELTPPPNLDQLGQLLSSAGRAALQPPPRIYPEDLPSSRQPAPVERTINVTIGRVEVKATREPAPVRRAALSQANSSVMSLDDYLKQRAAGGR